MYTAARFNKEILAEIFKSKDKTVYRWIGKDNRIYVAWKKATMISVF